MNESPATLGQNVNAPDYSQQPRNMRLTPRGATSSPTSRVFPRVLGGQCEFCGTIDPTQPGDMQYKLCPHYRGMDLKCVYCPPTRDQEDVVRSSRLNVREHPYRPGELLVWCQQFDCIQKHEAAFKQSS